MLENIENRLDSLMSAHMQLSSVERLKKCAAFQIIFTYFEVEDIVTM